MDPQVCAIHLRMKTPHVHLVCVYSCTQNLTNDDIQNYGLLARYSVGLSDNVSHLGISKATVWHIIHFGLEWHHKAHEHALKEQHTRECFNNTRNSLMSI